MPVEFIRPGPWARDVYLHEAGALIEELRRFIGHDTLVARTQDYRRVERVSAGVRQLRLRENQPLIEAFEEYEKATWHRTRRLRNATGAIGDLAHVAAHFRVVNPTLRGSLREHQRGKLIDLGGQLKPLLLEWKTASHFGQADNAELAWLPVDESGPEFIVRGGGLEWEVECKRQTRMIAELVGQNEADQMADLVVQRLNALRLRGNVKLTVPLEYNIRTRIDQAAWTEALESIADEGEQRHLLPGDIVLEAELLVCDGLAIQDSAWEDLVHAELIEGARLYGFAGARNGLAVDPTVLQIVAPRRNGEQLIQYLWDRKFNRAADQCSGERAAVLVFEWEDVNDPRIFVESEGIYALLARTFDEHRHVAAMIMRCDPAPNRLGGIIDYAVGAYAVRSNVTNYPEVAQRVQLVTVEQ